MNDRVKMTEMKALQLGQGTTESTGVGENRLRRRIGLITEKGFEFRVKMMRGEGSRGAGIHAGYNSLKIP